MPEEQQAAGNYAGSFFNLAESIEGGCSSMENRELNPEEIEKAAGGSMETCPHTYGWLVEDQFRLTGEVNDAGYHHAVKCKRYICKRCYKSFWEDQLPGRSQQCRSNDNSGGATGSW